MNLQCNFAEAQRFLTLLDSRPGARFTFQPFPEGAAKNCPEEVRNSLSQPTHGTLTEQFKHLANLNNRGACICVMINEGDLGGRASKNVTAIRAFFADCDDGEIPPTCPLLPSVVVQSSENNQHGYFLLEEPCPELLEFRPLQQSIADTLHSDPIVKDLSRVMRLPGFWHLKDPANPRMTKIKAVTDRRYAVEEIKKHFPPTERTRDFGSNEFSRQGLKTDAEISVLFDQETAVDVAKAWLVRAQTAVEGAGGYLTTLNTIMKMGDFGLTRTNALRLLVDAWNDRCVPPWDLDELEFKIKSLYGSRQNPVGCAHPNFQQIEGEENVASSNLRKERPVLKISGRALHEVADESEAILVQNGTKFYEYGQKLVYVSGDGNNEISTDSTPSPMIVRVTVDLLRDRLSRSAKFTKFNSKMGEHEIYPPTDVALNILSRSGQRGFPILNAIIQCPTLRPDGTMLSTQGYDQATKLLLVNSPGLPNIPEHPTKADGLEALALLTDLLKESPFANEASRAVALSLLITPVVRTAFPFAPLHAISAPSPGTGKSFLVRMASKILTGRDPAVLSVGTLVAELEKRLEGVLLTGQSFISIDNVNGDLGGNLLCQMITEPQLQIRKLQTSDVRTIKNQTTVTATGNNIAFPNDMARRVLVCRLDANMEQPDQKKFSRDPFKEIENHRVKYINAIFVVVRAHAVAGFPGYQMIPSFDGWSRFVRGPLLWLGMEDPLITMGSAKADDPDAAQLTKLVAAWFELFGAKNPRTANELTSSMMCSGTDAGIRFKEVVEELCGGSFRDGSKPPHILGNYLNRNKGRVVQGFKISNIQDRHKHVAAWFLDACGTASTPEDKLREGKLESKDEMGSPAPESGYGVHAVPKNFEDLL